MKNGEDKASDKCNPDDNNFLQNKNAGFTSDLPLGLSLAETSTKSLQLHQRIGTAKSNGKKSHNFLRFLFAGNPAPCIPAHKWSLNGQVTVSKAFAKTIKIRLVFSFSAVFYFSSMHSIVSCSSCVILFSMDSFILERCKKLIEKV